MMRAAARATRPNATKKANRDDESFFREVPSIICRIGRERMRIAARTTLAGDNSDIPGDPHENSPSRVPAWQVPLASARPIYPAVTGVGTGAGGNGTLRGGIAA